MSGAQQVALQAPASFVTSWSDGDLLAVLLRSEPVQVALFSRQNFSAVRFASWRCETHAKRRCQGDLPLAQPLRVLEIQGASRATCGAFAPTDHPLLAVGCDGMVAVVDLDEEAHSGVQYLTSGISGLPTSLAFDSTGRVLAVGVGADVIIGDYRHDKSLMVLQGHTGQVVAARFPSLTPESPSAFASRLLSAGEDRSVRLWNLAAASCEHDSGVLCKAPLVSLHQLRAGEAPTFAAGSEGGRVFILQLAPAAHPKDASRRKLLLLHAVRCAPFLRKLFPQAEHSSGVGGEAGGATRVQAPARRHRARVQPAQRPAWDDRAVVASPLHETPPPTPPGRGEVPDTDCAVLMVRRVQLPVTRPRSGSSSSDDSVLEGRWGGPPRASATAQKPLHALASETEALPAWAVAGAALFGAGEAEAVEPLPPASAAPLAQPLAVVCVVMAHFTVLLSPTTWRPMFAAANSDLVHPDPAAQATLDTRVAPLIAAAEVLKDGQLYLASAGTPTLDAVCMFRPADPPALPWVPAGSTRAALCSASEEDIDPTLPAWLQPSPTQHTPGDAGFREPSASLSLFPSQEQVSGTWLERAVGGAASTSGAARATSRGGRRVQSSGYGSVKPRALFGADRAAPPSRGRRAPATLAATPYPPSTPPLTVTDEGGCQAVSGLRLEPQASSQAPAAAGRGGIYATARSVPRGIGHCAVAWASSGNALAVGFVDGSVGTVSMPGAWRAAAMRGDSLAATLGVSHGSVRVYRTGCSKPTGVAWSHTSFPAAAPRTLRQAAGTSAPLIPSRRRGVGVSASGAVSLLAGWGVGGEAVHLWGAASEVPLLTVTPPASVSAATFAYGDRLLCVASGRSLLLYTFRVPAAVEATSTVLGSPTGPPAQNTSTLVCDVEVAPEGSTITAMAAMNAPKAVLAAVATSDKSIHVVDLAVGRVLITLPHAHPRAAHALALPSASHAASLPSATYHTLLSAAPVSSATGSVAGTAGSSAALVWDMRCSAGSNTVPVASLSGHLHRASSPGCGVAISPCGMLAALGSDDNSAYMYDIRGAVTGATDCSGAFVHKHRGAKDSVRGVAFNPHVPRLATASLDGIVRLYAPGT